jgi:anti-anti-sigma factor
LRSSSAIEVKQVGNTKLISMIGNLQGHALDEFEMRSREACAEGMNIVLDMSRTAYFGPESLGSLIQLEGRMRHRREQLWLAGVPAHLGRILRTGQLQNYFMTTTMVSDALYRTAKAEERMLARLAADWSSPRQETASVDVRMELLQNVCQRIMATEETEKATLIPTAFASAGR